MDFIGHSRSLRAGFGLALILAASAINPAYAVPPDPCVDTPVADVLSIQYEFPGVVPDTPASVNNCIVYAPDQEVFPEDTPLAVLSNANGFNQRDYDHLLEHLAGNGFIAVACKRAPGPGLLDVAADVKDWFALGDETPVALIGHSAGGSAVVNAANENADLGHPHNIKAVVGIAPVAPVNTTLPADSTPSYLVLYGSKDQDTSGWEGGHEAAPGFLPNAGFAAYDRAGTEADTSGPILLEPLMTKAMIFVYGMDHDGPSDKQGLCYDPEDYISAAAQQCITRAYVTGFLRWRILGESVYAGMFKGDWVPASVAAQTTTAPDEIGNPAGSAIRLFPQLSPRYRRVLANFETSTFTGFSASLTVVDGDSHDTDFHSPHDTEALRVTWTSKAFDQLVWFDIPNAPDFLSGNKQNVSNLGFLSFRVGQTYDEPGLGNFALNPFNQNQNFRVDLIDVGNNVRSVMVNQHAAVPYPDRHVMEQDFCFQAQRFGDFSKSAMRTVRIPIREFAGIQLTQVRRVRFVFPRNTFGSLFFDNVEFTLE